MTLPTSMERLLWIDTAGPWCCVAITDGARVVFQRTLDLRRGHGQHLVGEIDAALRAVDMTLHDMDAIGVCTGPGGYAGLRVGIATAQGMASGARKRLVGVPRPEAAPDDKPLSPSSAASEAARLLHAGATAVRPVYAAPPDAAVSRHQPAPVID